MRSVLLCAILTCAAAADLFNHPIATLPTTGQEVKGKFEEHTSVFHAIPYAQAPLGDLRFTPPQPLAPSSDKIDATKIKSMCPQFEFTHGIHLGNEDCLHMSIYIPKNKDSGFNNNKAFPPSKPLPVMFWIFGGAFVLGDEQEFGWYNGNNLAHNEDVIIVAANYRVGAFGFLAHEDLAAEQPSGTTGNYGIQDQRMALRWVQDNIASFGGNPDDVTIFGQSAGGMSVCTLVANPINQGLFTRAVMQSGTCNSPEFYQELPNALDFGKTYGEVVGCDSDSDTFLSCMRGKKTGEIMYGIFKAWEDFKRKDPEKFAIMSNFTEIDHLNSLAMSWLPTLAPLMPFGPVVDGTEEGMPKLPYDAMRDGEHNRIAFMAGTTSNEGSLFLPMIPSIVKGVNHLPLTEDGVRLTVDHCLGPVIGNDVIDEMYPDLMALYDINDYKNYDDQLSHILRDYMFTCSTRRAVRQVSKWATEDTPVFLYQFNYMSRWLDFKVMGDYHTSEIYFLFDNAWPPVIHRFNKDDEGMAAIMGGYWTQFARSGNPNGENTAGEWPKFDVAGDNYLELNLPPIQKSALAKDACDFHDKMLGYADDL